MVLDEWENRGAVRGKIWNHIWLSDDDLPIQYVIVGVVAMVDDERKVYHETCGVALAVDTSIWLVGRETIVSQELGLVLSVDDNASASTLNVGGDIGPTADEVQIIVLVGVWVNCNWIRQYWQNRVLGVFLAAVQEGEDGY